MMSPAEIIAITSISGLLLTIMGFIVGNAKAESVKRKRIYERIDEIKKETAATYARQDLCGVTHKAVNESLQEIKADLKKLLYKNGVQ